MMESWVRMFIEIIGIKLDQMADRCVFTLSSVGSLMAALPPIRPYPGIIALGIREEQLITLISALRSARMI